MAIRKITASSISTGSIATVNMADESVTSLKIADGGVGSADIASGAITPAKLSTGGPYWDSSSNVGIGTSSPAQTLHVKTSTSATPITLGVLSNATTIPALSFNGAYASTTMAGTYQTSTNLYTTVPATGYHYWAIADSTKMTLDSSGNVGIGTSSPTDRLSVGTSSGGTQVKIQSGSGVNNCILHTNGTTDSWRVGMNLSLTNGSYEFYDDINNITRLILDASGNINIATSGDNAARLVINGADNHVMHLIRNGTTLSTHIAFRNGNGSVGTIQTNGTSTSYNTSSDYRLKENIAPMTGALSTVAQLKPCTYTWKTDGSAGQGFIAHELQAVVPDCVSGEKDGIETYTDADGVEKTRPLYQGVDTSFLVATLTAAIQELKAEIETLKSRLDAAGL